MTNAEKNREYEAMTDDQKRVAISKDVLALLEAGEIIPRRGVYIRLMDDRYADAGDIPEGTKCHCCVLGAATLAIFRRGGCPGEQDEQPARSLFGRTAETLFENCNQELSARRSLRAIFQNVIDNRGTFKP